MVNFPGVFRSCDRCKDVQHETVDTEFSGWGNGLRINIEEGGKVILFAQDLCSKCIGELSHWIDP